MANKEVKPKQTIKVKALPALHSRRLATIPGLTAPQFRLLQSGEVVELDKKLHDNNKDILKEAKDGYSKNRLD